MTTAPPESQRAAPRKLGTLWLEVTNSCQLACIHCYNESGVHGTDGSMTYGDWIGVIDQAAALGVSMVQMIGGEPTLYAGLPGLIAHARALKIEVEVYSNLVHLTAAMWEVFAQSGVRLATSYYSDDPAQHLMITGRLTLARTRRNIATAIARGIPIRVGLIDLGDDQRIPQAQAELAKLGVTNMGLDRVRALGRAGTGVCDVDELCGRCGDGVAAILPDGSVAACPLGRWLKAGDIRQHALQDLYADVGRLVHEAGVRPLMGPPCPPDGDGQCEPKCRPGCDPALGCQPPGGDPPPPPPEEDKVITP